MVKFLILSQAQTSPVIGLMENARDKLALTDLKVKLADLMVEQFSETWLGEMGYPEVDILTILGKTLDSLKTKKRVATAADNCGECANFEVE